MMFDHFLVLTESLLRADSGGALLVAGFFVITGLLPLPRTLLCVASGAVCGMWAVLIVLPSTTVGALIAFLIARHLAAERVQRAIKERPKSRAVLEAVESEGWRAVALLRFWSPIPTVAQSYLFGLTSIRLVPFTTATFIFTIPQVTVYVYLGAAGREALLHGPTFLNILLTLLAAATSLVLILIVTKKTRVALRLHALSECAATISADRHRHGGPL
jgi:uncharacterized membrane protein YdjX (TVP38/TMEM64 family)